MARWRGTEAGSRPSTSVDREKREEELEAERHRTNCARHRCGGTRCGPSASSCQRPSIQARRARGPPRHTLGIHDCEARARRPRQNREVQEKDLAARGRGRARVALRVAPVSGVCASRGCPGDPPRGMSEANDAVGGEGAASARPRTGDRTRRAPEARFIRQ